MAQSIKQHVDFSVGYRPQEITFIYVKDLVQAVFSANGQRYHRDGRIFHQRWKHIPQYGIQRPDTHGARTSVHAPHQSPGMVSFASYAP